MAASYVDINVEDFEKWLDSLHEPWVRKPGTAGVYLVNLGNVVAVRVHSSLGKSGQAMARARGAMHMSLVSLKHGNVLWGMEKATGRIRFTRTLGWEKRLTQAFDTFRSGYLDRKSFFDKAATVDRRIYGAEWSSRIEKIPQWATKPLLKDFHAMLGKGLLLSDKQEATIRRISVLETTLERMRVLYRAARDRGDRTALAWITSLGQAIKRSKVVTDAQLRQIERSTADYHVRTSGKQQVTGGSAMRLSSVL